MKQLPVLVLLFGIAISTSLRAQEKKLPLLQEIFYTVRVEEYNLSKAEQQWWHQNLEASAHYAFVGRLFNDVKEGKLKVCWPKHPYNTPMRAEELKNVLVAVDSIYVEDLQTGELRVLTKTREITSDYISTLGFYENWRYDSITHVIEKEVKGIVFFQDAFGENGSRKGIRPLFYLPLNSPDLASITDQKNAVAPLITYDMRIKNFDWEMRETDWWYENLEPSKRYLLVNNLLSSVSKGNLQAHEAGFPFKKLLTADDVKEAMTITLSNYSEDPYAGEWIIMDLKAEATVFDINWIRFHESWYFDPVKLAMHKQANGYALLRDEWTEAGELNREKGKPLFYVKCREPKEAIPSFVFIPRIDVQQCIANGSNCANNIDTARWFKQVRLLLNDVKAQKRPAYKTQLTDNDPDPLNGKILSPVELQSIYSRIDSVWMEDLATGRMEVLKREIVLDPATVSGMSFSESWTFSPLTYGFTKKVICIEPSALVISESGTPRGHRSLFRLMCTPADPTSFGIPENLIGSGIESIVQIGMFIYGDDNYYGPWWINNLEISKRKAMIEKWLDDIRNGKITAYEPFDPSHSNSPVKLGKEKVQDLMMVTSPAIARGDVGAPQPLTFSHISHLRFLEDWYFDAVSCTFHKKVKGVTLMTSVDQSLPKPLMYIPFNQ